ncbi:MAG TPA: methionine--tRNA ligase [Bradyrhizobium sp.]|uniref:methionine--tRNA ligase n=1 Tax=Bradyrhizobium sp. TaxID=376 RepID=UPI002C85BB04|nr:methionine--tRNA ligase [Bradyrhizobium sp.]HXB76361.1 methionine--tRNA ligase [Bradyrhizobium sp.]
MATRKKTTVKKKAKKVRKAARTGSAKAAKKRGKPPAKSTTRASKAKAKTRKTPGKSSRKPARMAKSKTSGETAPSDKKTATPVKEKPAPRAAKTPEVAKSSTTRRHNAFYITTAIAYPNGAPHIGHAYEAIATDALARFQRLDGRDVFFLTGTDEHGLKMIQTAEAEKLSPMEVATRNAQRFKEMDQRLNISFDRFIRTTEEQHHRSSQEIWRRMVASGDIYLDSYSGWYSVREEAYYAEEETVVGEDNVRRGPQGTPVEWVEERSYFFKLSAYQDRLLKLYAEQPDFIGPDSRKNEVISFVKSGLRDLSISRTTFDWGVKVPGDGEHVMYVWVDALTNYITGVGFPDENDPDWHYWPADVHIIGKDIIRFHAVYWPAFLMSAQIPVQRRVYAHGFLFNRGEKMSKSVGNVVDPFNLADQYGVDQMRYFFLREVPFGQDGSYNHEAIVARINADLANDLGNLAQRSLSMIAKQYQGVLPEPGAFTENDKAILAQADGMISIARSAMATQQIHQALNAVWAVVAEANRYFAGEAPWALAKTDPARQRTVLYVTAEVVRQIAILAQPAMPDAATKLLDILGIPDAVEARDFAALATRIKTGTHLPAPAPVFPRYIEPTAA